jgi:hypothetical protein
MSNRNKRQNVRVDFHSFVDLFFPDRHLEQCTTRDLSLNGIFVIGIKGRSQGEQCKVILHLVGGSSDVRLVMKGEVTRVDSQGLALHFTEVDLDSFIHLRNIVYYNSGDPDLVEKEWLRTASNT